MTLVLQIDAMRRIASCARAIRRIASGKTSSIPSPIPPPTPSPPAFAVVDSPVNIFPPPISISEELIALGLRSLPAEKISSAYERSALTLKSRFEEKQVVAEAQLQAVSASSSSWTRKNPLASAMTSHYLKILTSWRVIINEKVTQCVRDIREAHALQSTPAKKAFNTSAIPVLEEFFEKTPRPSRQEKQQLAIQTKMEYKQINTWFQNRRNRSHRDVVLCNSADNANDEATLLPPDLAAALTRILAHYNALETTVVCDSQDYFDWAASFAPFHVNRPEHAWPVSYPPLCSSEPFPLTADARGFCTPWYRSPVRSPVSSEAGDECDLLVLLQRWNLAPDGTDLTHRSPLRGTSGHTNSPPCSLPAPITSVARNPQAARCGRAMSSPPCEAYTASPPHDARLPMPTKVELRSPEPRKLVIVPATAGNGRRWGPTYPNRFLPVTSSPPDPVETSKNNVCLRTVTSALRGNPYPQGKPSRKGVAERNGPVTPKQRATWNPYPSTSAFPSAPVCGKQAEFGISPPPSPPTSLPALSRESSVSSLRSVSSTSSSASDLDLLLTPPQFPISVLDYPVPDLATLDDAPRGAAYLGYSLACRDYDPALEVPCALYSQFELAVPLAPEQYLTPTISSVLVC